MIINLYFKTCKKKRAVLFAVARAKYAEGIDFEDKSCRGLFMIGFPFLSAMKPKFLLKL